MSNCLFWALTMRLRYGGRLRYRQSHYGWWPHWYWITQYGDRWEFVPDDPERRRCPPPLFYGHVRRYRDGR